MVENQGWIQDDPTAIGRLIDAVDAGGGLAASPDTGSWRESTRWEGLRQAFPRAVTCDFKVRGLTAAGEHEWYDLKHAFDIGFQAGFRGPWCMDYFNDSLDDMWRGIAQVRDLLRGWMAAAHRTSSGE